MQTYLIDGRGWAATATGSIARRARGTGSSVSLRVHEFGGWTILEFQGELDLAARPLAAKVVADTERYVFDLHGVTFMDARGLAMIIDTQRAALDAGGSVRLAGPSSSVRRVLTITGCGSALPTFDTVLQAVVAPVERDRDRRQAP